MTKTIKAWAPRLDIDNRAGLIPVRLKKPTVFPALYIPCTITYTLPAKSKKV